MQVIDFLFIKYKKTNKSNIHSYFSASIDSITPKFKIIEKWNISLTYCEHV
jgi:hypothetical protein